MGQLRIGRRTWTGLAVVLMIAAGLGVWAFLTGSGSPPVSSFEPVESSTELDGIDMQTLPLELSVLDATVQPAVGRQQAEEAALGGAPSGFSGILDGVFARVKSPAANCRDCNAWVFSLGVGSMVNHAFFVAVVDAGTGEYLFGTGGCYTESCP